MKVIKLKSGSYRFQKMVNGVRKSYTFDHRPTQAEINEVLMSASQSNVKMPFRVAAESYIEARTNTLSPATIREYKGTLGRLSEGFCRLQIDNMTTNDVQMEVNRLAKDKSPKTVRNYHGFISSVLAEFRPSLALHTHLPMRIKKEPYIPSKEEIKALIEYSKGTMFEVPLLLGCCSMRRGEICALTEDDIEGNVIHITKDMVQDEHKQWIVKAPKTPTSVRDIAVPDAVIDAINRNGLYKGHPNAITDWMDSAEKKLGMQHFSFHKTRHYFASVAHEAGVSDADIMKAGGWQTDYVMKAVYRHSMAEDNSKAVSAALNGIL